MRVLFINPSEMTGEGGLYGPLTTPHMRLAYIASYLQSKGHDVKVIEQAVYKLPNAKMIDQFNEFNFCDEIKCRGLHKKIHWTFETRVDLGNVELFEAAVSAGCNWVLFGFESGGDAVLEGSKKGITKQDIINATANARKAKVPYVSASFIVGLPYETKETIEETVEVIRTIKLDSVGINIVAMYPGTDIYEMAQQGEGGIRIEPWAEMNWDVFDRMKPHVTVNDLSGEDLVDKRRLWDF